MIFEVNNGDNAEDGRLDSSEITIKKKYRPKPASSNQEFTIEDAVEYSGFGRYQARLVLICGILGGCDAMEMMLLSVLGPVLRCAWQLSSSQVAMITTAVFVGFLIGAPIWGKISDNFGRLPAFGLVLGIIAYFGLLTSISPNYPWLVFLRSVIGFAISGGSIGSALMSEFLPVKNRAQVLMGFQVFWAIGATFEIGIAYVILPRLSWRIFILISAIPIVCGLVLLKFIPESPRFLAAKGRVQEAEEIIRDLHRVNGKPVMPGTLSNDIPNVSKGSIQILFSKEYLVTTLILPFIWFTATFSYYGVVLISAEIFRVRKPCFANSTNSTIGVKPDCCQSITSDDYLSMIFSSLGEFFMIPINIFLVDKTGRKVSFVINLFLQAGLFGMLNICMSKIKTNIILFLLRAVTAGYFSICYMYTIEVYPTTIRSLAVGIFSSISRIGAMLTPYVAQVLMPDHSEVIALVLYASVSLVTGIFAILLPIETKGRIMPDGVQDEVVVYKRNESTKNEP